MAPWMNPSPASSVITRLSTPLAQEKSNSSNVFLKGNDAVFILISNDHRFLYSISSVKRASRNSRYEYSLW